jgi:hypothetical protein
VTDRAPRKLLRYSRTNPTLIDTGCLFRLFALIPQWRKVADMNSGSHGIRFPKLTATATLRLPTGATWRGDFPTREIDDNSGAAISVFLSHAKDRTPPARISQSLPRPPSPSPWGGWGEEGERGPMHVLRMLRSGMLRKSRRRVRARLKLRLQWQQPQPVARVRPSASSGKKQASLPAGRVSVLPYLAASSRYRRYRAFVYARLCADTRT